MTDETKSPDETESADEAQEGSAAPYRLTTLGELGPLMPMGVVSGAAFVKDFAYRKWRMAEEKLLGQYREDNPGENMGHFIAHMLGVMMTKVGPHAWGATSSDAEKQLAATQYWMGDVLYMYAYLRKASLGHVIKDAELECPHCRMKNLRALDLDDLDVRVVDDPAQLYQPVELEDGLVIFGELRKQLVIRPPRWQVMLNPELHEAANDAEKAVVLIKDCVCGAEGIPDGRPIAISDADLDELTKLDLERLTSAIEDTPGPQMIIELEKCTKCKRPSKQMIDYRYETFFTISSR